MVFGLHRGICNDIGSAHIGFHSEFVLAILVREPCGVMNRTFISSPGLNEKTCIHHESACTGDKSSSNTIELHSALHTIKPRSKWLFSHLLLADPFRKEVFITQSSNRDECSTEETAYFSVSLVAMPSHLDMTTALPTPMMVPTPKTIPNPKLLLVLWRSLA